jgi:NMD protein affecting ribosome stability and mRNA decay
VSGILLNCHRCGRQVYSSEVRDGLCLNCRVDDVVVDLRDEHLRLWRKRERYRAGGANTESIGRQIARLEDRMANRIVDLVPDEKAALEQLKRTLEKARSSRYDIRSIR